MDISDTPKADYVSTSDRFRGEDQGQMSVQTAPSSDCAPASGGAQQSPSCFRRVARSWLAVRWWLSRNVFAVPLPLLTLHFDIKLGDLLITLPLVAGAFTITGLGLKHHDPIEAGHPAPYAQLLVFFFAIRNNSPLLAVTGIPFERALFYHKLFAIVTIVLVGLHALAWLLARADGTQDAVPTTTILTGCGSFFSMVAIFVLSLNFIRRRFFEFFLRMHWVLFIVAMGFAFLHASQIVLVSFAPWFIDVLFRFVFRTRVYARGSIFNGNKSKSESMPATQRMGVIARDQISVTKLPGNITRIQFPRVRADTGEAFKYDAGQYAFLCVPTISSLQWHPFTISSSPHEDMVTFHIKALGDWTEQLLATASSHDGLANGADKSPFDMLVDGPYGSVSIDIKSGTTYSHFVLFSGGIGVTPMRSLANWLYNEKYCCGRTGIENLHFVWSVRDREIIRALIDGHHREESGTSYFPHELLAASAGNVSTSAFFSEVYLTRGEFDLESQLDQQLSNCMRYGKRPDTSAILRAMGTKAKGSGKKRVAVLVCGPGAMVHAVRSASLKLSREMKLLFDVHHELFEF